MQVRESVYKGHPTLSLDADSKYPFTFGIAKAKLIVENIEAVRAFVAKHDRSAVDGYVQAQEDAMIDEGARKCGLV